jgi:hypothetical protein
MENAQTINGKPYIKEITALLAPTLFLMPYLSLNMMGMAVPNMLYGPPYANEQITIAIIISSL